MKNPFTALAYAKAQIDVDLALERASEAMPTRRKFNVTYLLKDAVQFDVAKHQPGFSPKPGRPAECCTAHGCLQERGS